MRFIKNLLVVALGGLLIVTSLDYLAFAATGKSVLLGKKNTTAKVTTIKRTVEGPVLKLKSATSTSPPLVVNGRGRVTNLNSDLLDGLDSTAFLRPADVANLATKAELVPLASKAELTPLAVKSEIAPSLPILTMTVAGNGAILTGGQTANGPATVAWDAPSSRYLITLPGVNYHYSDYVSVATPGCSGTGARTSSVSGDLIVQLQDYDDGTGTQCIFNVVVWGP